MKIVAIHQPNYFPWLGYFYKINCADTFVILDDVDFQTGNASSLTNRTKLKGPNGAFWQTIPVKKNEGSKQIKDVKIDYDQPWQKKQLKSFQYNYEKSNFYSKYSFLIEKPTSKEFNSLSDLNATLIEAVMNILQIQTELVFSSTLNISCLQKDEKIAAICSALNATHYLSGSGARKYNRPEIFQSAGVELQYSNFIHPHYPQLFKGFIPGLSVLDVLFNCGPDTMNFIKPSP